MVRAKVPAKSRNGHVCLRGRAVYKQAFSFPTRAVPINDKTRTIMISCDLMRYQKQTFRLVRSLVHPETWRKKELLDAYFLFVFLQFSFPSMFPAIFFIYLAGGIIFSVSGLDGDQQPAYEAAFKCTKAGVKGVADALRAEGREATPAGMVKAGCMYNEVCIYLIEKSLRCENYLIFIYLFIFIRQKGRKVQLKERVY